MVFVVCAEYAVFEIFFYYLCVLSDELIVFGQRLCDLIERIENLNHFLQQHHTEVERLTLLSDKKLMIVFDEKRRDMFLYGLPYLGGTIAPDHKTREQYIKLIQIFEIPLIIFKINL